MKRFKFQDERKSIPDGSNLSQLVRHGAIRYPGQFENERLLVRRRTPELLFDTEAVASSPPLGGG